jgi:hypothetical protein
MKHLMPNDPRHEISRSTGGHFKRRHKRSPHRSRDVPLSLHCQHRQCSLHIPLRSNPTTTPEEKWIQYPCFLKCSGIINFKEAQKVEKELTQCIDTDAEEALFTEMGRKKRPIKKSNQQLTDRNYLFDECAMENQEDNESVRLEPVLGVSC